MENTILKNLQKEIDELETIIKNAEKENKKLIKKRRLMITKCFLELIAPYMITAGLTLSGFAILGNPPFHKDEWKIYKKLMIERDSKGNERVLKQDDNFELNNSRLKYYSSWQRNASNEYVREIKVFDIKNLSYEKILEILETKDIVLEDILGHPISVPLETRKTLTEEEFTKNPYLEAIIFGESTEEFTMHTETIGENILTSTFYILLNILIDIIISKIRKDTSNFNYKNRINTIKLITEVEDLEDLAKKLEIKKANIQTLTR